MLGFVFGITGPYNGELAHWSHLLAVRLKCGGNTWASASSDISVRRASTWASRRFTGHSTRALRGMRISTSDGWARGHPNTW